MQVRRCEVGGVAVAVKAASGSAERARLAREREWLGRAAHPGVVEVVPGSAAVGAGRQVLVTRAAGAGSGGGAGDVLVTRAAGAVDLGQLAFLPAEELCGFGAAAATTLADLHDLGIGHHGICDSHLVLAGDGAPVLCSLGRAGPLGDGGRADVQALAGALLRHLEAASSRRVARVLRRAAGGRRGVAARQLARDLAQATRAPRLPAGRAEAGGAPVTPASAPSPGAVGAATRATPAGRPSVLASRVLRRRLLAVAVALGVAAAGVGAVTAVDRWTRSTAPVASRPAAGADSGGRSCPAADAGCEPVAVQGGVFRAERRRWRLSGRDPVVVVGRWTCAKPLPAVLDRATGEIWIFAAWPGPGRRETAQPLRRVTGATTLAVIGGPHGCDRIRVTAGDGRSTVLSATLGSRP